MANACLADEAWDQAFPSPLAEVEDRSHLVPPDEVLASDPVSLALPEARANIGLSVALARSAYTTRRWSSDGDIEYDFPRSEVTGQYRIKREYVQTPGQSGADLSRDEYDSNLKWKHWVDDNPFYGYVSPRVRYNRFGFFRTSQAFSGGVGRRFEPAGQNLKLTLEVGPGVRRAQPQHGASVFEGMYTVSGQIRYAVSERLTFQLDGVDERSTRENYRTLSASLRNRLTERLWLKYELAYRKAFPFDSAPSNAESSFDAGISYRF